MSKTVSAIVKRVVTTVALLCVIMLLICGAMGGVVQAEIVPEKSGTTLAAILIELSVFLLCYLTARTAPQSRLPVAAAVAVVFFSVRLLAKGLLFPDAELLIGWQGICSAASALIAGCLAGMKKQRRR